MNHSVLIFGFLFSVLLACSRNQNAILEEPLNSRVSSEVIPKRLSDPLFFKLKHIKLDISVDWDNECVDGVADLFIYPYMSNTNNLTLDAKYMNVFEVSLVLGNDEKPLKFSYDSLQINIDLNRTYVEGEELWLRVKYKACPSRVKGEDKGLYFIKKRTTEKAYQLWTQGETEGASAWLPCIDAPNQRCTQEMNIRLDSKYSCLSNGKYVYSSKNPDETITHYWKQDLPHAPYLFMMAIGEFYKQTEEWRGVPISYYVDSSYSDYASGIFANTKEMLSFFSEKFDYFYPWQKYDQIVVDDFVSGAMENTTASVFYSGVQRTSKELIDYNNDGIVAHELAHHWFGNLVTCESWSQIAMNEAFATYCEYLWFEYKQGKQNADLVLFKNRENYLIESTYAQSPIVRNYYENSNDVFDAHSYDKGAFVLHMLRNYLGDNRFFKGIQEYLRRYAYQAVELDHLRLTLEDVCGEDLSWFFEQWFEKEGHLNLEYRVINKGFIVEQSHSSDQNYTYQFNLEIDVYRGDSIESILVPFKKGQRERAVYIKDPVDFIHLDPSCKLLTEIKTEYSKGSLLKVMSKNQRIGAQLFALRALKNEGGQEVINSMLNALKHPIGFVRYKASSYFEDHLKELDLKTLDLLMTLYGKEKYSLAKSMLAVVLNKSGRINIEDAKILANDSSAVLSNLGMLLLSEKQPIEALPIIRERIYSLSNRESMVAISLLGEVGVINDLEVFYAYLRSMQSAKLKKGFEAFSVYLDRHKHDLQIEELERFLAEMEILHSQEAFIDYYIEDLKNKILIIKDSE